MDIALIHAYCTYRSCFGFLKCDRPVCKDGSPAAGSFSLARSLPQMTQGGDGSNGRDREGGKGAVASLLQQLLAGVHSGEAPARAKGPPKSLIL